MKDTNIVDEILGVFYKSNKPQKEDSVAESIRKMEAMIKEKENRNEMD